MSRPGRRVSRAIRLTPAQDRDRYASEWRGDLESAAELGIAPAEVARGASRVAWRLRVHHWGRSLAGEEGGARAAVAWAVVFASLPILFLVGGPLGPLVLPVAMAVAYILAREGLMRLGSVVMLSAALLWVVCTVVYWWLWGVAFDALDANMPLPAITKWEGPALFVGFGSFITFWVAFVVSVVRRARLNNARSRG